MDTGIITAERIARPLQVGQPLNLRLAITIALENASTFLNTAETLNDFSNAQSLLTQALSLCDAICAEVSNPLSPLRPTTNDIEEVRRIKMFCHARMIGLLSAKDYKSYRFAIHEHLDRGIEDFWTEGHDVLQA